MTGTDDSLSAARLTDLVKRTLMVMFGRRPVSGTYTLDAPAVWQASAGGGTALLLLCRSPPIQSN